METQKQMGRVWPKVEATLGRMADILRYLPLRCYRIIIHLRKGLLGWLKLGHRRTTWSQMAADFIFWNLELGTLFLDCLGLSEFYESVMDLVKYASRPLSTQEERKARSVLGEAIRYKRIRIDESAWLGPPQWHICYVSGFHINSWGPMSDSLFIHELVHVWQFQQLGLRYIPLALRAQYSKEGYDYGGVARLQMAQMAGHRLSHFNLEQQADIIADFYRLREGLPTRWGHAIPSDLPVYEYFVAQLQQV